MIHPLTASTNTVLQVAGYARVSTDSADQQHSLTSQRQYFEDYIRRWDNWRFAGIYYDEGLSGTTLRKRDGLLELLAKAKAREVDLIVIKEVSRFARNVTDGTRIVEELKQIGVGIYFESDNIYTLEPNDEMRLNMMFVFAQDESARISKRVTWGIARRMEQGAVFGKSLLGYRKAGSELVVDEEEAEVVQWIFELYTKHGLSTRKIAQVLMVDGITTRTCTKWSAATINKILRNEKYTGCLVQRKTVTESYKTHKSVRNAGQVKKIEIEKGCPAIVARELWEQAQTELQRRAKRTAGTESNEKGLVRYTSDYWASSLVFCGECGALMWGHMERGNIVWHCKEVIQQGRPHTTVNGVRGCGSTPIKDSILEYCVMYVLKHFRNNGEAAKERLLKELNINKDAGVYARRDEVEQKVQRLQSEQVTLIRLQVQAGNTSALSQVLREYEQELQAAKRELECIGKELVILKSPTKIVSEVDKLARITTVAEVRQFLERIEVKDCQVIVQFKGVPNQFILTWYTIGCGVKEEVYIGQFSTIVKNN